MKKRHVVPRQYGLCVLGLLQLGLLGCTHYTRPHQTPQPIQANRMLDSVTFENSSISGCYNVVATTSVRTFTSQRKDLSFDIHLLANKTPIRDGIDSVELYDPGYSLRIGTAEASVASADACDQSAASGCPCQFFCTSPYQCEPPPGKNSPCSCPVADSLRAVFPDIPLEPGDDVTVILIPRRKSVPELINADDKLTVVFQGQDFPH